MPSAAAISCGPGETSTESRSSDDLLLWLSRPVHNPMLCVNGCKTKCDAIGATVAREVCFQDFNVGTTILIDGVLACPCCCKPKPPPPPACPCSESCGVDINIQISSVAGQASRKYELPHSSSSTAEL
ncbi:uncharacterized protein LOC113326617 isoform X5 [Papaver somniferum]|nr:uncharacterized protein LOC113326617 isoform X5 [Papaver somniferum]